MQNSISQLAALFAITLGVSSCSESSAETRPNVLLVCMDTVRSDRFGCYGYDRNPTTPYLDQLARESLVFRDTSAAAGWTKPSVPSFMTGTYPIQHGVYEGSARGEAGKVSDVLPEAAETLAEVFKGRNYRTGAIIENAQLRSGNGFEQGFDSYDDRGGTATEIRWKARDWIEAGDEAQPFFLYLHFLDAHWPYSVPTEYASRFASQEEVALFQGGESRELRDAINHGDREPTAHELASLNALYDGSIRYIDDELGQLFDALETDGLLENTVVCVIADHGEEFLEHGRVGHGHGLWENLLAVPWILRIPGRKPEQVDVAVSLVDLFPTLLAAAGILAPETHSGVDRIATPHSVRPIFAEHKEPRAYQQSLRVQGRKLVRRAQPLELGETQRAVAPGESWEIKFARAKDGKLRVLELQPGDASSSIEGELQLKARITEFDGSKLRVGGVPAVWDESTAFYGESDSAEGLRVGLPVKIKGRFEGGVLVARRVKCYEPDLEFDSEVRGTITAADLTQGVGTVSVGPLEFELDSASDWDLPEPYLPRESLFEFVASEADTFSLDRTVFTLDTDGAELSPKSGTEESLEAELDRLSRELSALRMWNRNDRRELDTEAIRALRGIGYAK